MKIKIVNDTGSTLKIALHPQRQLFSSDLNMETGMYARGNIPPGGTLYSTIGKEFQIAGMWQAPDTSVTVTVKIPFLDGKNYFMDENDQLKSESGQAGTITLSNKTDSMCKFLLYGNASCLLKISVRPGFCVNLNNFSEKAAGLGISLYSGTDFPDFISDKDTMFHLLNNIPISILSYSYMTLHIRENLGTGAIFLSEPDSTPFAPLCSTRLTGR